MILAEARRPGRKPAAEPVDNDLPLGELDVVALAVGEADRLDAIKAREGIGEADGGILAAGEEDERGGQRLAPSKAMGVSVAASTPSRQRTLTATISEPSGPLPRPKARTPQVLQNRWWMMRLLNW